MHISWHSVCVCVCVCACVCVYILGLHSDQHYTPIHLCCPTPAHLWCPPCPCLQLFKGVTISQGGVLPNIHTVLLHRKGEGPNLQKKGKVSTASTPLTPPTPSSPRKQTAQKKRKVCAPFSVHAGRVRMSDLFAGQWLQWCNACADG